MSLKRRVANIVEKLTDTHIYFSVPRGIDFAQDIAKSLPLYRVEIVFDIGARVGQFSKDFLDKFPSSHIYCFEPVSNTFRQLQDNLRGNAHVDCYRLAFGSSKRAGKMVLQGRSDMFFLLGQSKKTPMNNDVPTDSVDVVTLDEFCHTKGINRVNFLKIDTEGGDLDVLKGAVNMLTEQRIDLVHVEAGMNPSNSGHVSFESLKEFLESHGYFLFGIYQQMNEWLTKEPHLRWTNPIFISHSMIEMNRK
jgi:FkbM family methyltransferase